jgi:hypothetical protein
MAGLDPANHAFAPAGFQPCNVMVFVIRKFAMICALFTVTLRL